jgi:hypothetical protein
MTTVFYADENARSRALLGSVLMECGLGTDPRDRSGRGTTAGSSLVVRPSATLGLFAKKPRLGEQERTAA